MLAADTWMNNLHYGHEGAKPGVTVPKPGFNVDPILQKQADCIATMTYNEYPQILEPGQLKAADLVTFKWQDQGVGLLEDGLYITEAEVKDPKKLDKRTVDIPMPNEILAKEPTGAWTHKVYDAAMK